MKEKGLVTIKIYNVAGKLVKTLLNEVREAGSHKVKWHGENDRGSKVASGVYFYKMEAVGFTKTRKMVLLR
jgi:flagellar hook assembly protein FlgD